MKKKLLFSGIALCLFFSVKIFAQVPTAAFTLNQSTLCAGSILEITDASTDLPNAWSYTLEGAANMTLVLQSPTILLSVVGDYSITLIATNNFGESMPVTQTLSVKSRPAVTPGSAAEICTGDFITLSGSGAVTYTWSHGVIDGVAFPPSSTTEYTVTGTGVNGCENWASVVITVNPLPILSISGSSSVCAGSVVTLTASGANTYSWSTGAVTNHITDIPLLTTAYTVTGKNSLSGCTNTLISLVTVQDLPPVAVNSGSVCPGKTFTMFPSGASSYVFSSGSNTVAPFTNQSYTVTGTDANGCKAAAVSEVTIFALPVISASGGTICSGAVFTLTPAGALTYSYLPGLSATVSPASTTSYSITGTDINGCVSSVPAVAEVTVFAIPVISVNSGSICSGGVFTMTPVNAFSYTFSNASNTVSPLSNSSYTITGESAAGCRNETVSSVTVVALPVVTVNSGSICAGSVFTMVPQGANSYFFLNGSATVNPVTSTSYSVSGLSVEGCVSAAYAISDVTVYALPVISVMSGSVCLGGAYTMTASGAAIYNYQGGSATVSPIITTSYSVTGMSSNGCASSNTALSTVTVKNLPVLSIAGATALCSGKTATLVVTGASTYTWNISNSNLSSYTVNPSANTTYTVFGTDANGCTNFTTQSIVVNPLPTVTVNNGTICPGKSFTLVPSGALSYSYQGGSATVTPVTTTAYTIMGTDANGCISALAAVSTVSVVNAIAITVTGNTTICEGQTANLMAGGANTYSWSNAALTNTIAVNPVITTSYSVTGITSGCSNTAAVTVSVNALPVVIVASTSSLICIGDYAALTSGGAESYIWDNGSNGISVLVNPSVTTTYTVIGTDANACSNTATIVQNVEDCTNLAEFKSAVQVSIYPNPNNGQFTIQLSQETAVSILNSLGQVVYSDLLTGGDTLVTLADQQTGIYLVQLKQGTHVRTMKVVKN